MSELANAAVVLFVLILVFIILICVVINNLERRLANAERELQRLTGDGRR